MKNGFESFGLAPAKEVAWQEFEKFSKGIIENGYSFHAKEHDAAGRDPKVYHTTEHLKTTDQWAEKMAEKLGLTAERLALSKMAIAWHDSVIEYDAPDAANILGMIRRRRGARAGANLFSGERRAHPFPAGSEGNEGESGRLLELEMIKANESAKKEIFTEDQIRAAWQAIDATYPEADLGSDFKGVKFKDYPFYKQAVLQNKDLDILIGKLEKEGVVKGPLFFQPLMERPLERGENVAREILIVALSDLGAAGIADAEIFFKTGNDEMRELYVNLRKPGAMRRLAESGEKEDAANREKTASAFLNWLESQSGFAMWQALRFEKILYLLKQQGGGINSEEERGLRSLFSHFKDNVEGALKRAKDAKAEFEKIKAETGEKAAFRYLAEELGYNWI